jgi:hypothetical protein
MYALEIWYDDICDYNLHPILNRIWQKTIDVNRKPCRASEIHLAILVLVVLIKFLPNVHSHAVDK